MSCKIGQVSEILRTQGAQLILPVAILHAAAFALGYWISKISFGEATSRTISIECGMQVIFFFEITPFCEIALKDLMGNSHSDHSSVSQPQDIPPYLKCYLSETRNWLLALCSYYFCYFSFISWKETKKEYILKILNTKETWNLDKGTVS